MAETAPDGAIVSVLLPTLSHGSPTRELTDEDQRIRETAQNWQTMAAHAQLAEMHGSLNGIPQGRLTELTGRIASAGEQLGLAWVCSSDAKTWLEKPNPGIAASVAARAFAEMTGYYAISAAHGLGNVSLRALLLNSISAEVINKGHQGAEGFPTFSTNPRTWPPFNQGLVSRLEVAAEALNLPNVSKQITLLRQLLADPRWIALAGRRDIDFHRWRPQSVPGGVEQSNPWVVDEDGSSTLTVYAGSTYEPPGPGPLVDEAFAGLQALSETMNRWSEGIPMFLRELGVPVFKTDE